MGVISRALRGCDTGSVTQSDPAALGEQPQVALSGRLQCRRFFFFFSFCFGFCKFEAFPWPGVLFRPKISRFSPEQSRGTRRGLGGSPQSHEKDRPHSLSHQQHLSAVALPKTSCITGSIWVQNLPHTWKTPAHLDPPGSKTPRTPLLTWIQTSRTPGDSNPPLTWIHADSSGRCLQGFASFSCSTGEPRERFQGKRAARGNSGGAAGSPPGAAPARTGPGHPGAPPGSVLPCQWDRRPRPSPRRGGAGREPPPAEPRDPRAAERGKGLGGLGGPAGSAHRGTGVVVGGFVTGSTGLGVPSSPPSPAGAGGCAGAGASLVLGHRFEPRDRPRVARPGTVGFVPKGSASPGSARAASDSRLCRGYRCLFTLLGHGRGAVTLGCVPSSRCSLADLGRVLHSMCSGCTCAALLQQPGAPGAWKNCRNRNAKQGSGATLPSQRGTEPGLRFLAVALR